MSEQWAVTSWTKALIAHVSLSMHPVRVGWPAHSEHNGKRRTFRCHCVSSGMPTVKYTVERTPWTGERAARGVFAAAPLAKGELVETAHCILVARGEYKEHFR